MKIRTLLTLVAALPGLAAAGAQAPSPKPALTDVAAFNQTGPDLYRVLFVTSVGIFVVRVTRAWSPHAADRFFNLVRNGFYDDSRFFRVVPKFMAQFGIHGDPAVSAAWKDATLPAERARVSNTRGRLTFAQGHAGLEPHDAGVHQLRRQQPSSTRTTSRPSAKSCRAC